ncbi:PILR alpha-associated neural protein [Apteryx rowi]|uniref:PILR alpha-associated neural protein n=1 Tax=Apteryx rowi TaxID=308060 RepID=UPI000E1DAB98|nr:PILR alpha-associated neural protein [Apteryx rowi]
MLMCAFLCGIWGRCVSVRESARAQRAKEGRCACVRALHRSASWGQVFKVATQSSQRMQLNLSLLPLSEDHERGSWLSEDTVASEMEPSACMMLPLVSCIHSLQLWHFLLLLLAFPLPAVWSLRSRGPVAARPLCTRRSPSAPRPICIWDRISLPERDLRFILLRQRSLPSQGAELRHVVRLRRQAVGARPATPSGFEDGMPSSQYPWAIVWGPTVSDEDGGDTNSANPGFPPLGYTFVSPHGMATAQPNSRSLLHNAGLNLRETPATLRPFLFGPRGEGKSVLCFFCPHPYRGSSFCKKKKCPSRRLPLCCCSPGIDVSLTFPLSLLRLTGVDPQLYVTITISIIIVLVATGIIFKFCWDRNQKRRRHSGQQSGGRQQESQQPLTDLSPTTVSILGPYSDSLAPTPEAEECRQGQEGMEKLGGHGKSTAFQLNRIPLVNL